MIQLNEQPEKSPGRRRTADHVEYASAEWVGGFGYRWLYPGAPARD